MPLTIDGLLVAVELDEAKKVYYALTKVHEMAHLAGHRDTSYAIGKAISCAADRVCRMEKAVGHVCQ